MSTAVKESEHKVAQLGSLLFLNIFSVSSQPSFCLSCSVCQNPPTTISKCQMLLIHQCRKQIPASPWSPSLRLHQEALSLTFKLLQCVSSQPFFLPCYLTRFTKFYFSKQQWIHGVFFNRTHWIISYKRWIIYIYI